MCERVEFPSVSACREHAAGRRTSFHKTRLRESEALFPPVAHEHEWTRAQKKGPDERLMLQEEKMKVTKWSRFIGPSYVLKR